jgi:hypothetical protein
VFEDRIRAVLGSQVRDDLLARLGVTAVDQHELEVVGLAVSNNDSVPSLRSRSDWQELDLAFHGDLP